MGPKDNEVPGREVSEQEQPAGEASPEAEHKHPAGTHVTAVEETELDDEEEEVVAELMEAAQSGQTQVFRQIVRRAIHSGPVPSSYELQNYENVLPGLANRLVVLAENEQKIRGGDVKHWRWNETFKIGASAVVSLTMIGGGVFCTYIGFPLAGTAIATSGVAAGIMTVLSGKSDRKGRDDD